MCYVMRLNHTFTMFVSVLEGLDQPQGLIYRAPYWEVIHGNLPQDSLVIDDEQAPEADNENNEKFGSVSNRMTLNFMNL